MHDHDDCWDFCDDCEDCYDAGYESGWNDRGAGRRPTRGAPGHSDGCYIATAVYGSYDCPEVWVLRRFRDEGLRRSAVGALAVRAYYAVSPKLVARFGHVRGLCRGVKWILDRFVAELKRRGYRDTAYDGR